MGKEPTFEEKAKKLFEDELSNFVMEIRVLGAIPKEKGHHQGFSPTSVYKDNAKIILERLLPIILEEALRAIGEDRRRLSTTWKLAEADGWNEAKKEIRQNIVHAFFVGGAK